STQATALSRTAGMVATVSSPGYSGGKAFSAARSSASEIWLLVGRVAEATGVDVSLALALAMPGSEMEPNDTSSTPAKPYARRWVRAVARATLCFTREE